jgi:putative copper resistance protein D
VTPDGSPRRARLPRLAVAAWLVAVAIFVALGFAVAHYLSETAPGAGGHGDAMAGMHEHGATALIRAGGSPLGPLFGSALIRRWQLDAVAVAVLVLLAAWYVTAVALVPVRKPGARWPWRRTASFLAGLVVAGFATNGSIAVYDQALFTAHMVGHLALVMLAPALLMAGVPLRLALEAAAPAGRRRIERVLGSRALALLTAPPVALACYTAVIVGSHLTGLMDTIMRNSWAGQAEHLVYLLVGCQFFVLVLGDQPLRWRLGAPARWLLLAVAMAVDTFTGVVLLQGTHAVSMLPAPGLHVDPLSDTHTGGAIMWFGGDAIMAAVMVTLVVAWLRQADERGGETGWLEQARRDAFTRNVAVGAGRSAGADGAASDTDAISVGELDSDEQARLSYNAWLARLEEHR